MKNIILLFAFILLTGCMEISNEIQIKNDDSGTLIYQSAMIDDAEMEQVEDTTLMDEFLDKFPETKINEIEYEKDGEKYFGEKMEISFANLNELNEVLNYIYERDETDDVLFVRENNQVTLLMAPEEEEDDFIDMEEIYSVVDFEFSIQLEGQIIEHNATEFDRATNTVKWNLQDQVEKGFKLVYRTNGEVDEPDNGEVDEPDNGEIDEESKQDDEETVDKEESEVEILPIIIGGIIFVAGVVILLKKSGKSKNEPSEEQVQMTKDLEEQNSAQVEKTDEIEKMDDIEISDNIDSKTDEIEKIDDIDIIDETDNKMEDNQNEVQK